MALYVAIVALVNLALGYALALFLHGGTPPFAFVSTATLQPEGDEMEDDEFEDWET